MKKAIFISILFISTQLFSQSKLKKDSIPATQIKLLNTNYKDFILVNGLVYALTKGDSLVVLNVKKDNVKYTNHSFAAITKNSKSKIIGVTNDGIVMEQNSKNNFIEKDKVEGKIYKIVVDKYDDFVVITDEYIRYKKENFTPEKGTPMYRKSGRIRASEKLIPMDYIFLDKEQNIWFAYDAGEWGGDVCFFNLKSKEFIYDNWLTLDDYEKYKDKSQYFRDLQNKFSDKIKITKSDTIFKFPYELSISSGMKGVVYDDADNIFISSSGMHFSIDGSISKIFKSNIKGFYKSCFDEDILDQIKSNDTSKIGKLFFRNITEYLGPLAFNKFNNSIYYYSSNGFYKLSGNQCKNSKEFVFKPWISWTAGLPDAVGYQMNVKKFEFVGEKEMIFLTSKNGIGYFDGKSVKYFK